MFGPLGISNSRLVGEFPNKSGGKCRKTSHVFRELLAIQYGIYIASLCYAAVRKLPEHPHNFDLSHACPSIAGKVICDRGALAAWCWGYGFNFPTRHTSAERILYMLDIGVWKDRSFKNNPLAGCIWCVQSRVNVFVCGIHPQESMHVCTQSLAQGKRCNLWALVAVTVTAATYLCQKGGGVLIGENMA